MFYLFFEHTISNRVMLKDGKVNQAYSTYKA